MYSEYYKFTSLPFQLTPDGSFFFGSSVHNRAMGFLNYGIMHGEGYVVITGEVGAGKTTLVEHLLANLDSERYLIGRIVTTQLDSENMLRMVAGAFGFYEIGLDKASLLLGIRELLISLQRSGKRALLIVDEAQSLSNEALEELRMLSNITVPGGSPIQGILLGQPEFRTIMASTDLEQLRQRVIASCHLGALDADDTKKYIVHRLQHVGWDEVHPSFSEGAFAEIYRFTGGIPRKINGLVSRLLLLGFIDEESHFSGATVARVAKEISNEISPLQSEPPDKGQQNGLESSVLSEELHTVERNLTDRFDALEKKLSDLEVAISRRPTISEVPQAISKFR